MLVRCIYNSQHLLLFFIAWIGELCTLHICHKAIKLYLIFNEIIHTGIVESSNIIPLAVALASVCISQIQSNKGYSAVWSRLVTVY